MFKRISWGIKYNLILILISATLLNAQTFMGVELDTVKSKKFDTGKMWTFEHAPVDYFEETYGFKPDDVWLDDVRLSAAKFASWCSSSFVTEDGLIMTNHHCVDFISARFEEEGEDIHKNGFFAPTLEDERKIPGLTVRQYVRIVDVTKEVTEAVAKGETPEEKAKILDEISKDLVARYTEDTEYTADVISLYNGGKFSIYLYKTIDDIRAVYFNESEMGLYGGDPDNFTYPRYNPDFAFLRAYDKDGKPLKVDNYFKWSKEGAKPGEPLFVVGNPGSTQRLKTVSQLEYMRDYRYNNTSYLANSTVDVLQGMINDFPEKAGPYKEQMVFVGNGAKVYTGIYKGLLDPVFLARKKDFEKKLKDAVDADEKLSDLYGHLWEAIADVQEEKSEIGNQRAAYNVMARYFSDYFAVANDLLKFADELSKPEADRKDAYKGELLKETIAQIYPEGLDQPLEERILKMNIKLITDKLGSDNEFVQTLTGGKLLVNDPEYVTKLAEGGPEAIYSSKDPLVQYILATRDEYKEFTELNNELTETEAALEYQLGQALYAVFGTTIPPDATMTIRITDGVMKGYDYNGTVAPLFTTFYGMYDRYYSHQKKYPWDLPERWLNPKEGFDMSTPYNFITTHDIVGGSSGSAMINKDKEVVGLAFDGNIESIPGNFLYNPDRNRNVSVTSQSILQILRYIGGAERIAVELEQGKIVEVEEIEEK